MAPSVLLEDGFRADEPASTKPICQIVTPTGMFGYGYNKEWTEAALDHFTHNYTTPTAIICDSGSTDSGPSKLALGTTTCPKEAYVRDFRELIRLAVKYKVPILMSSAGGDGSDEHVDWFVDLIRETSEASLKVVTIYSQVDKSLVQDRLSKGSIVGCGRSVPELTAEVVEQTPRIVAQMGPEPLLDAMMANPDLDVLIAGRAYDVAPFVAFSAYHALSPKQRDVTRLDREALGGLTHMGKILECGGLCATPKGLGACGVVYDDYSFDIRPLDPRARCTALSVAAHTLYEKSRPDILPGPGGYLDLSTATYTQLGDGVTTRVRGSLFYLSRKEGLPYTVKLEGARVAGFRTLVMGSFADPILVGQMHSFLADAKAFARQQYAELGSQWDVGFHVHGLDQPDATPSKVFVVTEVLAETQATATSIASALRVHFAHGSYPGQKATSGNFGMGIGGIFELETGPCAEFSIYHLMALTEGEEHAGDGSSSQALFSWRSTTVNHGAAANQGDLVTNGVRKTPRSSVSVIKPALPPTALPSLPESPQKLFDIAKVIRSKNAGPFEVTLDVMFDRPDVYHAVKGAGILSREAVAQLYNLAPDEIIWAGFFDVAMAFKATLPRTRDGKPSCSGGFMEDDVHGSQKYTALLNISLPAKLVSELKGLTGDHSSASQLKDSSTPKNVGSNTPSAKLRNERSSMTAAAV